VAVNYSEARPASVRNFRISPLFEESTSHVLAGLFNHRENEVNEYKEQVLLPHMFSRNGPFISTGDVDGDGSEDFFVGGAAEQAGSLYVQKNGRLVKKQNVALEKDKAYEDMGSVLFDVDQDKDLDLYVVSGGSEFSEGNKLYADRLYVNDRGNFRTSDLIQTKSSGSCVVPIDIDGDGDLDLFRGGQVVAGMYPKSPKSYLLINENGKLIDRTKEVAPVLSEVGMVSSALSADVNGDKIPELVIVGEWMPVKVFQSKDGKLEDISSELGLDGTEGWWSKIIADDLDGDGDFDLIAGNIGENYKFKASKEKPFQVFAKDFDRNGTNDIFLARYYKDTLLVPIRGRECTSQQMPVIAEKFPTYLSFAQSDLPTILGRDIENALHKKAHLFSSVILINENGKFSMRKLPTDAQLSAITGIIVNDFDKDGKKDILLAGNKFDTEVETTPADASPGLFLKGLGGLNYKPMKPLESGFFVPYNVKDIQPVTLNKELAIIIGINNEGLKIFKSNVAATKGPIAAIK
jgi:enediyne biosynthesis protein E4